MNIGEALRLIRTINGLTQKELARELELSDSYVSELERGNRDPSLSVIGRYADFFELPMSSLMLFAESVGDAKEPGRESRKVVAGKLLQAMRLVAPSDAT